MIKALRTKFDFDTDTSFSLLRLEDLVGSLSTGKDRTDEKFQDINVGAAEPLSGVVCGDLQLARCEHRCVGGYGELF